MSDDIYDKCLGQETCEDCRDYQDTCDGKQLTEIKNIDWNKVTKDERSYVRIAKELNIDEKTIRRNLKKLNVMARTSMMILMVFWE